MSGDPGLHVWGAGYIRVLATGAGTTIFKRAALSASVSLPSAGSQSPENACKHTHTSWNARIYKQVGANSRFPQSQRRHSPCA